MTPIEARQFLTPFPLVSDFLNWIDQYGANETPFIQKMTKFLGRAVVEKGQMTLKGQFADPDFVEMVLEKIGS